MRTKRLMSIAVVKANLARSVRLAQADPARWEDAGIHAGAFTAIAAAVGTAVDFLLPPDAYLDVVGNVDTLGGTRLHMPFPRICLEVEERDPANLSSRAVFFVIDMSEAQVKELGQFGGVDHDIFWDESGLFTGAVLIMMFGCDLVKSPTMLRMQRQVSLVPLFTAEGRSPQGLVIQNPMFAGAKGPLSDAESLELKTIQEVALAFLFMCGCANTVVKEVRPVTAACNAKRLRKGKAPFDSYRVLTVELGTRQEIAAEGAEGGGRGGVRLHAVRGHVRIFSPTHRTWVRPHLRGDVRLGRITKAYSCV